MDCYTDPRRVKRVGPTVAPDLWERLRESVEGAYREGNLSDNEHDDLMNRWATLTGGRVGERS